MTTGCAKLRKLQSEENSPANKSIVPAAKWPIGLYLVTGQSHN